MSVQKYEYRPQPLIIFLGTLFFGACGWFLADAAMSNDKGLIINRAIEMNQSHATIFYGVLAAISFAFVAFSLYVIYSRFTGGEKYLEIHDDHFIVPPAAMIKGQTVAYKDVKSIKKENVSGTVTVIFATQDTKARVINRNFKSKQQFEEAIDVLVKKVG